MARDLGCSVRDLMRDELLRKKIDLERYVSEKVGLPTLKDILGELLQARPRSPGAVRGLPLHRGGEKMEDVKPGMKLPGIVTNVTAFGVFVDIGVHQDGLVHISELSNRYRKKPRRCGQGSSAGLGDGAGGGLGQKTDFPFHERRPSPAKAGFKKVGRKREEKRPEKNKKPKSTFTNNPFATALRDKKFK